MAERHYVCTHHEHMAAAELRDEPLDPWDYDVLEDVDAEGLESDALAPVEPQTVRVSVNERPTIPVPRASGIRLNKTRIPIPSATIDIVVCDLSRDPRSESYLAPALQDESPEARRLPRAR